MLTSKVHIKVVRIPLRKMKVDNNRRCVKDKASVTAIESLQTIDNAASESHR